VAVIIPAHNEGEALIPALRDVRAQMRSGDRVLVVADNCVDDTAAIARAAGAEAIERRDTSKIGKGYALDFGVQYLRPNPPAVVIIIDADCRLGEAALNNLAAACLETGRPAQAINLMTAPAETDVNYKVAEFAWRLKNLVRPLGLYSFGLPCPLMGTGMAFPWKTIETARLASASIVEDLQLGLSLANAGFAPRFCPSARVTSVFPISATAARGQRTRWEQGHVMTLLTSVPRGLYNAIIQRNRDLLVLILDLSVPPLSLLVMLLGSILVASALATFFGSRPTALIISLVSFLAFAFAVFIAWRKYGRDLLPLRSLLSVIFYILDKLPIYRNLFSGSRPKWTRTEREKQR
jgi:cellulose synthase/poly-beta-1,6-N-acetylglucosamine synthase-like glycosyltransferase